MYNMYDFEFRIDSALLILPYSFALYQLITLSLKDGHAPLSAYFQQNVPSFGLKLVKKGKLYTAQRGRNVNMGWYQKLAQYFPDEEMKRKEHLEGLIYSNPNYKKVENEQYILLYGDYEEFVFVDYVLVSKEARGQGIGSQIIDELKEKQKVIVLEVEPVDPNDPDTAKREQFYLANDFQKAEEIIYYLDVGVSAPELQQMEIYYWSPQGTESVEQLRSYLIQAYQDIHLYQFEQHYERPEPDPQKLVQVDESLEPQP